MIREYLRAKRGHGCFGTPRCGVVQLVEHLAVNQRVGGSSPPSAVFWCSSMVEQSAHDRQVAGSIPVARIDGRCSLIVKPLTVDQEDAGANPVVYP